MANGGAIQLSNIWLNGKYVTYNEWKNAQKIKDSGSLYHAYVPSIISEPYGALLRKCGVLYGSNEKPSNDDCGLIYRKIQCSVNLLHESSFRHLRCNDPGCPVCYIKFTSRMAERITERLQGFRIVYRGEQLYHLIFWGSKSVWKLWNLWEDWVSGKRTRADRPYADLRDAFNEAKYLLEDMGVTSAVVWYHPYRIKKELKDVLRQYRRLRGLDGKIGFWKLAHDDVLGIGGLENYIEYGPHFHAVAAGYLEHVTNYFRRTGAGYKKKRYLEKESQIFEVSYYTSTHACREAGKQSIRYYGNLSYRMLAREMVEEKIKNVVCQVCGAELEEHDCDENGVCIQKLKDKITEKIKYYLYWKKGQNRPEMLGSNQCLITRFSRSNG